MKAACRLAFSFSLSLSLSLWGTLGERALGLCFGVVVVLLLGLGVRGFVLALLVVWRRSREFAPAGELLS
ncbi:hypothetical protein, partial [Variovorax defluvii]|uniref:hypothetical protein n=1 Tax=Variovorax defluvii TaxID=913761 RepID=UPI0031ED0D4E